MTIQELREARNKAWEGAKAFVESKRDKDGLLSEEDAKTYAEMEKKIKNYSTELERMEQMEALENELSKPVNVPIVTKPAGDKATDAKTGRASDEYKEGMLKALRSNFRQVSNILQEGVDSDGGYLVPEEYDKRLIDVLEEENITVSYTHLDVYKRQMEKTAAERLRNKAMDENIKKQILYIRSTGLTNMFDVPMVQRVANEYGFYELVVFLEENRADYVYFILYGEK